MNHTLVKAVNKQINKELYSSYLYLAMAAYAKDQGLGGFANWFFVQAKEELDHAMGFFNYLWENRERIVLEEIAKPPKDFPGMPSLFKAGLKHERYITGEIKKLAELAGRSKDKKFGSLLKWYIEEQVEEEEHAGKYLKKMALVKNNPILVKELDEELSKRRYSHLVPKAI